MPRRNDAGDIKTDTPVTRKDTDDTRKEVNMWLEKLKEFRTASKLTNKQIAEKEGMPERTVARIFSGETESPSVENLRKITRALGCSLDDIFEDTKVVVGRVDIVVLQAEVERLSSDLERLNSDLERLNGELALASAENAVLNSKITTLTAENDILRLKLEHKEELIALHNYYNKVKASE